MKQNDYCRYLANFRRNRKIVFTKREDLIDFAAMYIANLYEDYLRYTPRLRSGPRNQRVTSEPRLVKMFAEGFLIENVPEAGIMLWLNKKFGWNMFELRIGTSKSMDALYERVVTKIAQGERVDEVFPTYYNLCIRNDNELVLETIP